MTKTAIRTLREDDSWDKMLMKGTILWRHCTVNDKDRVVIGDTQFQYTQKGSYMGRVSLIGAVGLWEPEVLPAMLSETRYTRGIAVFTQENPPADWTHLIITGVSNPFKLIGKPEKGGCIFAEVGTPYSLDHYEGWREEMYNERMKRVNASIDEALEISNEFWPGEIAGDQSRLIIQKSWEAGAFFDYVNLK